MDSVEQRLTLLERKLAAVGGVFGTLASQDASNVAITGGSIAAAVAMAGIGSTLQAWDGDLDAFAALDATAGLLAKTGSGAFARRTLQAPAAGITIANPAGTLGDPTFALANDLAALEGLSVAGFAARTGADAWSSRTLQAGTGISISNPAGTAGDPTITCTVTAGYTDGSTIKAADGAVGTPGLTFNADTDNGAYRLGTNNWALTVGGAKALELKSDGNVITTIQTAFLSTDGAATDVTGDGTSYLSTVGTERIDNNADYSAGVLTAPFGAMYALFASVELDQIGVGHTSGSVQFATSNRTIYADYFNPTIEAVSGTVIVGGAYLADMDAGDTAQLRITVSGSTKTVDLSVVTFGGYLACGYGS